MSNKIRDQRLEEGKRRASTLVSMIDLLGKPVDAATIEKAALVKLSPMALQAAANLAYLALANIDGVAAVLAGQVSAEVLAHFADVPWPEPTPDMQAAGAPAPEDAP